MVDKGFERTERDKITMQDKQNEVVAGNSKKLNGFTITAIVMWGIGFLINPFCILSILGVIFAGVGIAKAYGHRDKTWVIISLVVSIMETVIWVCVMANALAAL